MAWYSVTVRSLALAGLGFGAVSAFAQSPNVTAFNPYNGVGTAGGSAVGAGAGSGYAVPQGSGAMAFNPWNPAGVASTWGSVSAGTVQAPSYGAASYGSNSGGYSSGSYGAGSNLPEPPAGPIESRLTAVPQMGSRGGTPPARVSTRASAPTPAATPAPVVARAEPTPAPKAAPVPIPPPAAAPPPVTQAVVVDTPAPPPPAARPPAPPVVVAPPPAPVAKAAPPVAPAPKAVASAPPPPPAEPASTAPAPATSLASVTFVSQSAEISGAARGELEKAAQSMKGVRGVELRAYAGGPDPAEARKVALARALAVRSYLIDQGVKTRIEVGAFASSGGGSERVDVLVP